MKRYMKLIRTVLEYVECHGNSEFLAPPEVDGYTPEQVLYHVELCAQAGYIEAQSGQHPRALTWQGHEALDKMRSC